MMPLLHELHVAPAQVEDDHCCIELDDGLQVNIVCNWMDSVIFAVNLGVPAKFPHDTLLWSLLEKNLFCELPQVQISAAAEEKKIIVWTQERLIYLDARTLRDLFGRLMHRAREVQSLMNGFAARPYNPAENSSPVSGIGLARARFLLRHSTGL